MSHPPAIAASAVNVSYGPIRAVQNAHLVAPTGEITALVGSNGAGKSSFLKGIAGLVGIGGGSVVADGVEIAHQPARHRVREHGVVLVPEGRSVFATMTVLENLELGARVGRERRARRVGADVTLSDVHQLFPALRDRLGQRAQYLSGGEQQMVSIARSLLMCPSVLLVDEPSMGLAPRLVHEIFAALRRILVEHRLSIVLVEQDVAVALHLATTAAVLEQGRVTLSGPAADLLTDPRLRSAYLGEEVADNRMPANGEE